MSWNMGYLRTFLTMFNRRVPPARLWFMLRAPPALHRPDGAMPCRREADKTRVFFPDKSEMLVAKRGKGIDPNAGSWVIEAQFQDTRFQARGLAT